MYIGYDIIQCNCIKLRSVNTQTLVTENPSKIWIFSILPEKIVYKYCSGDSRNKKYTRRTVFDKETYCKSRVIQDNPKKIP